MLRSEGCGDLFFKRVSLSSTYPSRAETKQYQVTRAGSRWTDQRLRSLHSSRARYFLPLLVSGVLISRVKTSGFHGEYSKACIN